jgi:serine/threonine protein kinase
VVAVENYGRYSLLQTLGVGSLATAFHAKQLGIEGFEKQVVVKRVHSVLAADAEFIDGFLGEARTSMSLSHGSIARVLDLGSVDLGKEPSYFLTTEYVAGHTLASVVDRLRRQRSPLPPEIGLYLAVELCKVLDYAHRQRHETGHGTAAGIAHGNLSLRNVMLSNEGELKVTDFRLRAALLRKNLRANSAIVSGLVDGDDTLLAPEQLIGAPPSPSADVFSLAGLLYRCFLAGLERERETLHTPIAQLLELDRLPDLGATRGDLPPQFSKLLGRAFVLDPESRPETASSFHEALLDLISHKRLRSGRGEIVQWLEGLYRSSIDSGVSSTHGAGRSAERPRSFPPAATTSAPHDVSILALHANEDLSLHEQDRATAVMARFADRIMWPSPARALAVFAERDGRDTETAVRCGLTLLRALREQARSLAVAIDLGVEEPFRRGSRPGISEGDQHAALQLTERAEGRVVVTRRAARELRYLFKLKRLGHDTLAVTGVRPLEQASGAFFDRETELKWLFALLDYRPVPRFPAALLGPIGIGKTRLLREFALRAQSHSPSTNVIVAACPPQGSSIAYSGVAALLGRLCEVREGDSYEQWERARQRLESLGFDWQDIELVLRMLQSSPVPEASNDSRLVEALTRYLGARTEDVFVLDNAQRLDSESVRVLRKVFAELSGEQLVFIFSARSRRSAERSKATFPDAPGKNALALGFPHLETLRLEPLGKPQQRRIIASRLHVESVPDALAQHFMDRAQGNPFVLEELLRESVGQGQLVLAPGRIKEFHGETPIALPRSVHAIASASNAPEG